MAIDFADMRYRGTVNRVDSAEKKVYVDLTKGQIKDSPSSTRTSTSAMRTSTARLASTTVAIAVSDSDHPCGRWAGGTLLAFRPPTVHT